MHLFTHQTSIARTPEQVFDFFVDFAQGPSWRTFVRTMALAGPLGPGGLVHVVMDIGGADYAVDLEVLACDRPSLWRHRTTEVDYRGVVEYRFTPEAGGTHVTLRFDLEPTSVYGWLGLPLLLLRRGRSYRNQLPSLKRELEGADQV